MKRFRLSSVCCNYPGHLTYGWGLFFICNRSTLHCLLKNKKNIYDIKIYSNDHMKIHIKYKYKKIYMKKMQKKKDKINS